MRRSFALAALLCCTALVEPAQAGPVLPLVVAVGGAWAGSAVATALGGAAVLGTVGAAAVHVGVATVIGIAAQKIMAPSVPSVAGQQTNIAQDVSYMERVYGATRKGGPYGLVVFAKVNFEAWRSVNAYVYTIIHAAHRINAVLEHYLDDRHVTVAPKYAGYPFVTTEPYSDVDAVTIKFHDGAAGQVADPLLLRDVAEWTAAHDMAGLAYSVVTARQHLNLGARLYPTGRIPTYAPVLEGNAEIYDPRDGSTGYTENWALAFAHELVTYWGLEVDWDDVGYEADHCDLLMQTGDGTQRRRWAVGGTLSDDMTFEEVCSRFLTAADGFMFEGPDGKTRFYAGRYMEPTVTIGPMDFNACNIGMSVPIDAANEFTTRYTEPNNAWRESVSGVWENDPEGSRSRKEIRAYLINDHYRACAIAKRAARAEHAQYRITGTLNGAGRELVGQRFVTFNHPEMGVSCVLEIQKLTRSADRMTWTLEAVSTIADDWTLGADEEPARPVHDELGSDSFIDVIGSLTVAYAPSSGGGAALRAQWGEQSGAYRQQLRFGISGSNQWQIVDYDADVTSHLQTGLVDGATYEWQIRNVQSGKVGVWSPPVTVAAVADTTPPPALVTFDVSVEGNQVVIDFDTPNSPKYVATRLFRGTTTDFNAATLIATVYGSPNVSDGATDAPSAGTYRYWGRPINASGVAGPTSGPVTVTVI